MSTELVLPEKDKMFYRRKSRNKFFGFCLFILIWISAEGLIFLTRYDARILKPVLSYVKGIPVESEAEIFKVSDSQMLYALTPLFSATTDIGLHSKENKYSKIDINVNKLGFRGSTPSVTNADKKIVLFIGGSNTLGISVSDADTYTEILNQEFGKDFEYINAGVTGYVMTQKIAYAEELIEKYDPAVIVIQLFNKGRRSFWYGDTGYYNHFYNNPELFLENIPLLFTDSLFLKKLHYRFVKISPLYRFVMAGINNIKVNYYLKGSDALAYGSVPFKIFKKYYEPDFAVRNNKKAFEKFIVKYGKEIPVLTFNPTIKNKINQTFIEEKKGFYNIVFGSKGLSNEYFEKHPPSFVYRWYALEIANILDIFLAKLY